MNAQFNLYPELGRTVIVFSNYDPPAADHIANRIEKMFSGVSVPAALKIAPKVLQISTGTYQSNLSQILRL